MGKDGKSTAVFEKQQYKKVEKAGKVLLWQKNSSTKNGKDGKSTAATEK